MHRAELGKTLTSECIALIRKGFNKGLIRVRLALDDTLSCLMA